MNHTAALASVAEQERVPRLDLGHDDRKAYEHAQRRGIITKDTMAIIRHMVAVAIVTAYERFGLLQSTRSADRILHNPPSRAVDLLS